MNTTLGGQLTPPSVINERNSTEFCRRIGSEPDHTAAALLVLILFDFSFLCW